ncbi:hypothetical protein TCAL_08789 [Tigriopus californicus]|uniref:Uncharacterized protein n=1 Tax=Tigriopus californicus TaxID=6832 RepID=A0A553PG38_TIGCA|nr:hypothetical protein TCAL_08789 [Tigriopus californicus]|eukprot:TCALIF_08789-PA protein Name:"Protein of unknown function" AED:0.13 eAED:0.13 QI:0/0.5/0.66/0.66/0.5/0.66/3/585/152
MGSEKKTSSIENLGVFGSKESNINQLLSSEANEKSDLGRHIGLQRIAWALEHGSREEPAREVPKNHFDEFGTRGLTASGSKIWNGKRFLGVNAFLPKRSLEEAISEYGRVIKRSGIGAPQLGSPSTLLITVPKTKYSEIKMPGDFRIMKRSY